MQIEAPCRRLERKVVKARVSIRSELLGVDAAMTTTEVTYQEQFLCIWGPATTQVRVLNITWSPFIPLCSPVNCSSHGARITW